MTDLRDSKISVIGGSGFVGTYFCRLLAKEGFSFEIIDIVRSAAFPNHFKYGDVRDVKSLRESMSGHVVVNLAAVHSDDIREEGPYREVNVQGARNIVEICTERNIKNVIFTSSVAVYGFSPPGTSEEQEPCPFNHYGRSKKLAEDVFVDWARSGQKSLTIVRPTVIFGEGNRGNVYTLFNQIRRRRFVMVGKGQNKKSMAYVENVAAFLCKCLENERTISVVNYIDTPDLTTNELVLIARKYFFGSASVGLRLPYAVGILAGVVFDWMSRVLNKKFPISAIRVQKFSSESSFASNSKERLGFEPPFQLQAGLIRTLHAEFPLEKQD